MGFTPAIKAGNTIYLSGQVPINFEREVVGEGDIEAQAEQVWRNIGSVLRASGATYANIVKTTTYLVNPEDSAKSHEVQRRYLGEHRPASTLIKGIQLARPSYLIEIDCTAVLE
jgi:enamine deaminase RidA (YjgF/YER057c/UK114 family)